MIICLLAAFFLSFLTISAMAGTETGEFCPTCVDWTNVEGWLAKEEAYERAQQSSQQAGQLNGQASNPAVTAKVAPPQKGYAMPELFTSPASIKSDQVILDVRSMPDYLSGHIPGSRSLYWKDLQRNGILDQAQAKGAFGRAGVNESDRLLVYGDSGEGAAFVFWALCCLGHKNVSLLDGGTDAIHDAGVDLITNAPSPMPSNYTVHIVPWLLVTPDNLGSMLALSDVRIVDARDFSEYGRNRINKSLCLSPDKIYEDFRIKDAGTLVDLFGRRLEKSGTAIVYGTPQAYSLFYSLRIMGYNASLLEGDWWKETKWAVCNVR
ncbi:MAG: rhodanese-like domain-containing protein [Methanothrix sp.]|nr:rhodanese-like domain-containing protein [Methanothrix sp.]